MSSSSSQRQGGPGLTRYVSAPSSFLKNMVDSVINDDDDGEFSGAVGSDGMMSRFYSGDSSCLSTTSAAASSCKPNPNPNPNPNNSSSCVVSSAEMGGESYTAGGGGKVGQDRSFGYSGLPAGGAYASAAGSLKSGPSLIRHSSSPAGFFSQLMVDNAGFSVTRGLGNFSSQAGYDGSHGIGSSRLKSQLSFSRQDSLSRISEGSIPDDAQESVAGRNGSDDTAGNMGQSYMAGNFPLGSWDDTNSIVFSPPPNKRTKDINGNIVTGIGSLETQFSLPQTSLEMATVEKLLQIQPDSVPCRIRAKRGCATHPRSIAERDRRTRISEKLKKLEELLPNVDKQTNTAEMLDMAVLHIRDLQSQVQMLKQECTNCTCGSKQIV